jgi:hypothetical protein
MGVAMRGTRFGGIGFRLSGEMAVLDKDGMLLEMV